MTLKGRHRTGFPSTRLLRDEMVRRSRRPSAAGRRFGPEAVTVQGTGYATAHAIWTEVLLRVSGTEYHRLRSFVRAVPTGPRRVSFAIFVAWLQKRISALTPLETQVG